MNKLYGKPLNTQERDKVLRLAHAESDWRQNNGMEFAMIAGAAINRGNRFPQQLVQPSLKQQKINDKASQDAVKNLPTPPSPEAIGPGRGYSRGGPELPHDKKIFKNRADPLNAVIDAPYQFQAVSGSRGNKFQPSDSYKAGPSPSRAEAIQNAIADNLHRVPEKLQDFTASDKKAYNRKKGTNVGYLNSMKTGEVWGRTKFRNPALPFDATKVAPYKADEPEGGTLAKPADDTVAKPADDTNKTTTSVNKSDVPSSTSDNLTARKPPRDAVYEESAAWQRKEGKNPEGGLNKKGIASYRREHPGSKLSLAVTTKPSDLKPGSKAANRRKSFCARMGGMPGPMKDENGKPTRKALSLRKWNCEE